MGRILRFDGARKYGFIRPHDGGADVFMHANDFAGERALLKVGMMVEFEATHGDRGVRAVTVRSVDGAPGTEEVVQPGRTASQPTCGGRPNRGADALSTSEFMREVTDVLIAEAPTATGLQIAQIRKCFGEVARSHGWVLD